VPPSVVVSDLTDDAEYRSKAFTAAAKTILSAGCTWPLLAKPNAGGFGAGVVRFSNFDELIQWAKTPSGTHGYK
jgi:hypothetical protein